MNPKSQGKQKAGTQDWKNQRVKQHLTDWTRHLNTGDVLLLQVTGFQSHWASWKAAFSRCRVAEWQKCHIFFSVFIHCQLGQGSVQRKAGPARRKGAGTPSRSRTGGATYCGDVAGKIKWFEGQKCLRQAWLPSHPSGTGTWSRQEPFPGCARLSPTTLEWAWLSVTIQRLTWLWGFFVVQQGTWAGRRATGVTS